MNRRTMLSSAAWSLALPFGVSAALLDGEGQGAGKCLIVVILRGGLDALAMIPAHGDRLLNDQRRSLAVGATLALDSQFSLNPRMRGLHRLYRQNEAVVAHAVSTPYRGRSHFDAQQVLESGGREPYALTDGWLGRTARALTVGSLALGRNPPLLLRGDPAVATWTGPGRVDRDLLDRLESIYEDDQWLQDQLRGARSIGGRVQSRSPFAAAARLASPDKTLLAAINSNGWDTHSSQERSLDRKFAWLDEGLMELRAELGARWQRTVVMVLSEFGRTVRPNGSDGTDHGTGTAALLVGGALRGGRVLADWPGLATANLYEGRDLMPTADTRSLIAAMLHDHLGLDPDRIGQTLLPGVVLNPMYAGLIRSAV